MFELTEKNVKSLPEMNDSLLLVTKKINQYQQIAKNSVLAISLILSDVAEKPKEYLQGSGFDKIVDYAETLFGYKKAYTYKLIKISKFINLCDKNGEKLSVEYLLDDNKNHELTEKDNYMQIDVLKDSDGFEFATSQMLELLPLTSEQIKEHINELDSSLSCKEIRAVVKDIISPPIEVKVTESDTETDTESTEQEEIKELTDKERILQMLEICSNMEDAQIKEKIINVFQKSIKALEK